MTNENNLNTLRSVPEFFGNGHQMTVVVPKIQRAYAQGRISEQNLRTLFVDEIFCAVEKGDTLELSFVYGAKSAVDEDTRFELLDGQQRITTLILVYWYVASAEKKKVPDFIKSFTYETRTTSSSFLEELAKNTINIDEIPPSRIIRSRQWYTTSFDKDSSVNGMMNMLDAIHQRYLKSPLKGDLFCQLGHLKFYELDLEDFGLTEEIYVKMNARGLQLTPFENFKADLIKFMKRDDMPIFQEIVTMDIIGSPKAPYFLNFSQKLDNRWLNLFWRKEDKTGRDYCTRFFRFFYRFFGAKCYLDYQRQLNALDFRPKTEGTVWDFFWRLSPKQDKTYLGFKQYNAMLEYKPEYIKTIELILDWLSKPETATLIEEVLIEPWNPDNRIDCPLYGERFRLTDAVLFAAICEYVERSGENFNADNFRRWMRIVRNAIADQLFRNVNEIVTLSRNFVRLLEQIGSTTDIYRAIANLSDAKDMSRNIRESIQKAKIICENPDEDWESAFIKAESHPFFAGTIGFLLKNLPSNPANFTHRAEIISTLFDVDGMTEKARNNHRLIRALVRQLRSRDELLNSTITERKDADNHLRSFLLEKESVKTFLCKLGDMESADAVYKFIDSLVDTEPQFDSSASSLFDADDERLKRAFRRICTDSRIYDFIVEVEQGDNRRFLDFMARNGNYTIDRRRSWWDRIYIGTDRLAVVQEALSRGYTFLEESQRNFYDRIGDVYESSVWLNKELVDDHWLKLYVNHDGNILFCIKAEDKGICDIFPEHKEMGEEDYIIDEVSVEDKSQLPDFIDKLEYIEALIEKSSQKNDGQIRTCRLN